MNDEKAESLAPVVLRPYEAPDIDEEMELETTALAACGTKTPGGGEGCAVGPNS